MTHHIYPGLAAVALACALPVQADKLLEEIVVTSSRVDMPLREVGTSISVINRQQIEQLGFNSLYEVLRTQPSVAVSNTGGPGKAATLRIRGEEGYRTLVLLDGIDISDTSGPQVSPRMEQLLSSGIERVEILRGPQGLMYGADAGGVVNIRTQTNSDGFGGTVSAEGGRYGTQQLAAGFGAGNTSGDFHVSAIDYQTDGFNARSTDTVLRDDDGFDNTTLHARARWRPTEHVSLEIVARNVEGENAFDSCFTVDSFAPTDDCRDDYRQKALRVGLDYSSDSLEQQLDYSRSDTERSFFSAGSSSFMTEGELERISYLGSIAPVATMRLVYGAELERESIDDGTFDETRDQAGYYLEWQGGFLDALYLTAGARYDDNDDFGSHSSYRASAAYLLPIARGELKFKGSWGTGFRAPSLYEIAYNRGLFAFPPASETTLSEEESEGYDLGLAWTGDSGLYLEATYFDQSVSDEIFFDLVGFSGYLQGSGEASSSGLEVVANWPILDSLSLAGNYTLSDTDTSDGSARAFRPEHFGNIGLNWQSAGERVSLGLNLRFSRDAENTDGSALDDYEVVDINASFAVMTGLELYGRLENLLDEDYQEVPTYNTARRAAYAGLRYNF